VCHRIYLLSFNHCIFPRHRLNRIHNLDVSHAPAHVAGDRLLDFVARGMGMLAKVVFSAITATCAHG
jgi:hypothetical protein